MGLIGSKTTVGRSAACPRCGSVLALAQTSGAATPVDSDCVCDTCGTLLWIDSELKLRRTDAARWRKLPEHDRLVLAGMQRRILARVQDLSREHKAKAMKHGGGAVTLSID